MYTFVEFNLCIISYKTDSTKINVSGGQIKRRADVVQMRNDLFPNPYTF